MSNIKDILESSQGKELKSILLGEYYKLNDVSRIKDCKSAEAQAIEVKAQKKAIKILGGILNKIMEIPKTPEEKEQYYNL
jgi:hypothetical protein